MFVPPHIFEIYLESADAQRYSNLLAVSFVKESPKVAKCPGLNCELFSACSLRKSTVLCKCGRYFCFSCGETAHEPVRCQEAKAWIRILDKIKEGEVAAPERSKPIKNCPNGMCGVPTFKDRGCMYMSCSMCKEHWCWMCGQWGGGPSGKPEPHHVGSCNDPANQFWGYADGAELYSVRFEAHLDAVELSHKLRTVIPATARELGLSDTDFKLTCQAVELLLEYRHFLAWSYAWRMFEIDSEKAATLQDAQATLEGHVERLSEMIEGDAKDPHASWLWTNFGFGDEFSKLANDLWGKPPEASFQLGHLLAALEEDVARIRDIGPPASRQEDAALDGPEMPGALEAHQRRQARRRARARGRGRGRGAPAAVVAQRPRINDRGRGR